MWHTIEKWMFPSEYFAKEFDMFLLWRSTIKSIPYDWNVYGNNAFSKQLELNNTTVDEGSVICEKCHKWLINKCEVKCITCGNIKQKKYSCVW